MEIVFKKIPFEDYLAFFETDLLEKSRHWIRIQYDYLKEPSWLSFNTYELYCPFNISINKGSSFVIPTGFKCISEFKDISYALRSMYNKNINLTKEEIADHIVIEGTASENCCFQEGEKFLKIKFFG